MGDLDDLEDDLEDLDAVHEVMFAFVWCAMRLRKCNLLLAPNWSASRTLAELNQAAVDGWFFRCWQQHALSWASMSQAERLSLIQEQHDVFAHTLAQNPALRTVLSGAGVARLMAVDYMRLEQSLTGLCFSLQTETSALFTTGGARSSLRKTCS